MRIQEVPKDYLMATYKCNCTRRYMVSDFHIGQYSLLECSCGQRIEFNIIPVIHAKELKPNEQLKGQTSMIKRIINYFRELKRDLNELKQFFLKGE